MIGTLRAAFHRRLRRRAGHLAGRVAPHLPAGANVLDIGSGTGHNAEALRAQGTRTCVEADVVDFHVVGSGPVLLDGTQLPFADRSFDSCLLAFVLSYPDDPAALLREAARVASRCVLVLQSSPRGRAGRLALWLRGWFQGRVAFRLCSILRLIPPTRSSLRKRRLLSRERVIALADEAGLRPARIVPEPGLLGLVSRDLFVLEAAPRRAEPASLAPPNGNGSTMELAPPRISVIIPARNEAVLIAATVGSVLRARDRYREAHPFGGTVEVIVVDNASDDGTTEALSGNVVEGDVLVANCEGRGAARARNLGASLARGRSLIFLDADTQLPRGALVRIAELVEERGYEAGITLLGALDGDRRARCWWAFWNAVRRLPLAQAKAMPACMFCTREAFDEFGPFDERVDIGEEWPILAGLYRTRRRRFVYDRAITALSSARRMELQRFGYARTFARYVWAVLCFRGRVDYPDHIWHASRDSALRRSDECGSRPEPVTSAGSKKPRPGMERWPAWLGPQLGKLRLNAIEPLQVTGRTPMIAKRRLWFGPLLIRPGNLYLRLLDTGVRVLPAWEWQAGGGLVMVRKMTVRVLPAWEWQARERELHRVLHGIELESGPRGRLILPRWPGVVLADHARDRIGHATQRLRGLYAASRALRALHGVELVVAGGTRERLSHGDATLRNVLFDPETGEARWFDFDTAHDPGRGPAWRHGDDLRALIYSAVESFADLPVASLLRTIRDAYSETGPWEQVRDRLTRGDLHRSPLHYAQASPPIGRRREVQGRPIE
jgi:glycosyltransferase involved in cell wall biosynthesis/SAM-dependent methyltransferase